MSAGERTTGQGEVRLDFATLFGEQQRQNHPGAEPARQPGQSPRPQGGGIGRQAARTLAEQLFPARNVTVFDPCQSLEEIAPFVVRFHAGKLSIQKRGIPLVGVVLVPRGVGANPVGKARVRRWAFLGSGRHTPIVVP